MNAQAIAVFTLTRAGYDRLAMEIGGSESVVTPPPRALSAVEAIEFLKARRAAYLAIGLPACHLGPCEHVDCFPDDEEWHASQIEHLTKVKP